MLSDATVLVLDEPTNHLDLSARAFLCALHGTQIPHAVSRPCFDARLCVYCRSQEALLYFDGAILMASHDRQFAAALATRVIALESDRPGIGDVALCELSDYSTYLASRPLEAAAHQARADSQRVQMDARLVATASTTRSAAAATRAPSATESRSRLEKPGRRASARQRGSTRQGAVSAAHGTAGKSAMLSSNDGERPSVEQRKRRRRPAGSEPFWKSAKKQKRRYE